MDAPSLAMRAGALAGFLAALTLGAGPAAGQAPPAVAAAPASAYLERYRELDRIGPLSDQVADVQHLVLERDAGRLTLERGRLWLFSPVGGRTVGAVFRGSGRFAFAPRDPAE